MDDDSNRDDETSIASRKKRAAAVAAAATGDEASLYNLSVDSFADRDNTQQHQVKLWVGCAGRMGSGGGGMSRVWVQGQGGSRAAWQHDRTPCIRHATRHARRTRHRTSRHLPFPPRISLAFPKI